MGVGRAVGVEKKSVICCSLIDGGDQGHRCHAQSWSFKVEWTISRPDFSFVSHFSFSHIQMVFVFLCLCSKYSLFKMG